MAVLDPARTRIDPPAILPVEYLSWSSLRLLMVCPEAWRRRYLEREPEPSSGKMILGSATHAACAQHYGYVIERGHGLTGEELLDQFADEFEDRRTSEDVEWGEEQPGVLKDAGAGALAVYHQTIAPQIEPVAVEREFELSWPGLAWRVTGFLDLEEADGALGDYKATARRISQKDADADLQADIYCAARRAEANPASAFRFHAIVRTKTPLAEIVPTERTDEDLDRLTDRIFGLAREIQWRCETDTWSGAAPGTWFCSTCRYPDCPLRLGRLG